MKRILFANLSELGKAFKVNREVVAFLDHVHNYVHDKVQAYF